jgi:hypothetical protein
MGYKRGTDSFGLGLEVSWKKMHRAILYYEFGAQHKTITKDKIINSDDIF